MLYNRFIGENTMSFLSALHSTICHNTNEFHENNAPAGMKSVRPFAAALAIVLNVASCAPDEPALPDLRFE